MVIKGFTADCALTFCFGTAWGEEPNRTLTGVTVGQKALLQAAIVAAKFPCDSVSSVSAMPNGNLDVICRDVRAKVGYTKYIIGREDLSVFRRPDQQGAAN